MQKMTPPACSKAHPLVGKILYGRVHGSGRNCSSTFFLVPIGLTSCLFRAGLQNTLFPVLGCPWLHGSVSPRCFHLSLLVVGLPNVILHPFVLRFTTSFPPCCFGRPLLGVCVAAGLPYLNPWQLPGNGMDAFRLAKEATLRALDSPMDGRPEVVAPPSPAGGDSSSSSRNSSGSSVPSGWRKEGARVVTVKAHARRGVDDDGTAVRSRL